MNKLSTYLVTVAALAMLAGCVTLPPSTAVSYHVGFTLVNSSNTAIADLASMNSAGLDQQLMISTPGRILVSAQVQIQNPGGLAVRGACQMLMSDGTGPTNGLTVIGRPAVWFTTINAAYDLVVPVLGYAEKKPGKYNVVVECQQLGVSGGTVAILGNMIVWEAAK